MIITAEDVTEAFFGCAKQRERVLAKIFLLDRPLSKKFNTRKRRKKRREEIIRLKAQIYPYIDEAILDLSMKHPNWLKDIFDFTK